MERPVAQVVGSSPHRCHNHLRCKQIHLILLEILHQSPDQCLRTTDSCSCLGRTVQVVPGPIAGTTRLEVALAHLVQAVKMHANGALGRRAVDAVENKLAADRAFHVLVLLARLRLVERLNEGEETHGAAGAKGQALAIVRLGEQTRLDGHGQEPVLVLCSAGTRRLAAEK